MIVQFFKWAGGHANRRPWLGWLLFAVLVAEVLTFEMLLVT